MTSNAKEFLSEEDALLAAIQAAPNDQTARLVYADWLDEHDRPGGAYLRVECELASVAPNSLEHHYLQKKLRNAGVDVDAGWLARVSRVPIENCRLEFRFQCPKRWEQLRPTVEETIRFCDQCLRDVVFCESVELAKAHAAVGNCVAVDARLVRKPGDLETPAREWGRTVGILR
jgi:uncharacterized protein (TIGR02996 family)